MHRREPKFSKEEAYRRFTEWYFTSIRPKLGPEHKGKYVAIDLDGYVESAPLIQPNQAAFSSFQGKGEISGSFTETSAKNLALQLNYGALPVRLNILSQTTVSPTLGKWTTASALSPVPLTWMTTPSPHLAWTTSSPPRSNHLRQILNEAPALL